MMSVNLSVLDPLRMDQRLVRTPTSTTYAIWGAAGRPCLRQSCGHDRGSHIRSEGMECSECDCLGFVDFANPDDSEAGGRVPTDPNPLAPIEEES